MSRQMSIKNTYKIVPTNESNISIILNYKLFQTFLTEHMLDESIIF